MVEHVKELLVALVEVLALALVAEVREDAAHLLLRDLAHWQSHTTAAPTALERLLQQVVLEQVLRAAVVLVVGLVHAADRLHLARHEQAVHAADRRGVRATHRRGGLARASCETSGVKRPFDLDHEKVVREGFLWVSEDSETNLVLDERRVVQRAAQRQQLITLLQVTHQRHLLLLRQQVVATLDGRRV